ncbi:MAG: sigma-54-dependent Fis family transcriptional regulator [Planctomycetes bacterium]|nr:sigma-54-dependent Fis family transcriptional regulator [Planctomycetota bacterium]
MKALSILVVDDQPAHADLLAEVLSRAGHKTAVATGLREAKARIAEIEPDLVITDLDLGGDRGTDLLRFVQELKQAPRVMVVSGVGAIEDAVTCMQLGAVHYFTKPLDVEQVRRAVAQLAIGPAEGTPEPTAPGRFEGIIGTAPSMLRMFETVRRIAPTSATVLVTGENGTGKELVARAVHRLSPRRDRPFVALNCAALSEGVLESELFGHERGAFTGAARSREGKFEFADGGTLFLDEVGDMPLSVQVKLLRVIQEREIIRVGSNRSIKVDVRLVAATNRDLAREIQQGRFREDLYWRLKVVSLHLPPLRERQEDIPALVRVFLEQAAVRNGRKSVEIDAAVITALQGHSWPGNVRQLQNTVETMLLLSDGGRITIADLPPEIVAAAPSSSRALAVVASGDAAMMTLDQWERELIRANLERHKGNRTKVAKALGISERTLYRKLREYGLS